MTVGPIKGPDSASLHAVVYGHWRWRRASTPPIHLTRNVTNAEYSNIQLASEKRILQKLQTTKAPHWPHAKSGNTPWTVK